MDNQLKRGLRSLIVIVVMVIITMALFRSWQLALLVTAALMVHELGHILAAASMGVRWELILNPFGLGTLTLLHERRRLSQLQNAMIHLSGPGFSLLLALIAMLFGIVLEGSAVDSPWRELANLSALLAVVNILPIGGISDGGRYLKRLYASLPEQLEPPTVLGLLIGLLSAVAILRQIGVEDTSLLIMSLMGFWLVVHMLFEAQRDDPAEAASDQAMSFWEALLSLILMLSILLVSSLVLLESPFWLKLHNLVGIASGLVDSLTFLQTQGRAVVLVLMLLGLAFLLERRRDSANVRF